MSSISGFKHNHEFDSCRDVIDYVSISKSNLIRFFLERGVELKSISQNQLIQAEPLGKGISGARKIILDGKAYVLKLQDLTSEFKENLISLFSRNAPISHSLVGESDDSFADFPRKEFLGARIASILGIEIPATQLVSINSKEVASLQEYLPQEKAVAMIEKVKELGPANIDLQSAFNIIFFHAVTENIDGHYGNILLKKMDQIQEEDDDEGFNPDFKAVPIDFGLIFPRHDSVYPDQTNLVKKDFFKFFECKSISIAENLRPLVMHENILSNSEIRSIARDHELRSLNTNFRAMQNVVQMNQGKKRIRISELFDQFVSNVVLIRSGNSSNF